MRGIAISALSPEVTSKVLNLKDMNLSERYMYEHVNHTEYLADTLTHLQSIVSIEKISGFIKSLESTLNVSTVDRQTIEIGLRGYLETLLGSLQYDISHIGHYSEVWAKWMTDLYYVFNALDTAETTGTAEVDVNDGSVTITFTADEIETYKLAAVKLHTNCGGEYSYGECVEMVAKSTASLCTTTLEVAIMKRSRNNA